MSSSFQSIYTCIILNANKNNIIVNNDFLLAKILLGTWAYVNESKQILSSHFADEAMRNVRPKITFPR